MSTTVSLTDKSRTRVKPGWWIKPAVFSASLLPFCLIVWSVVSGNAGPNPVEAIEKQTGEWSLRFLLLSLAMTPMAQIVKSIWPVKLRRMIGLFAFFYVVVHLLAYVILDQTLNVSYIIEDIFERPFITAGFVAFLIMLPLALTSNRFMVKKLGKQWKALHRMAYVAGVAGVLHYVWLAKGDQIEPLVYLAVLLLLLAYRLPALLKGR